MNLAHTAPWLASPCAYGVHVSRGQYQAAPHVQLISDAFRRCALTPRGRLMIIAPPRHGKTTTASNYGPAWYLSLFPERRVLLGSHSADFSGTHGEHVRNLLIEHGSASGVSLDRGRKARQHWRATQGGGMRSVGRKGVAGIGAHLLILDDTVAGQEEALSEKIQEDTWQWYLADFSTRRESPDTSMVVIGTRWSERDLLARLLNAYELGPEAEGYEPWEILYLPAICDGFDWTGLRPHKDLMGREVGEALWEEKWSIEHLRTEEKAKPWWFAALYQGRPQPLSGGLLKKEWPNYWRLESPGHGGDTPMHVGNVTKDPVVLPEIIRTLVSVDANALADMADLAEGRERSDAAIHVWALATEGRMFVLDRLCGVFDIDLTSQSILSLVARYSPGDPVYEALRLTTPPPVVLIEAKANGPAVMSTLRRKGITCVPVTPIEGKVARVISRGDTEAHRFGRATMLQDGLRLGKVHLPHPGLLIAGHGYSWTLELVVQWSKFPRGGRDDTDAASQAYSWLERGVWHDESKGKQQERRNEERARKHARLPKGVPLPKNLAELHVARSKALTDALEKKALKQMEQNLRPRAGPRRSPWGR